MTTIVRLGWPLYLISHSIICGEANVIRCVLPKSENSKVSAKKWRDCYLWSLSHPRLCTRIRHSPVVREKTGWRRCCTFTTCFPAILAFQQLWLPRRAMKPPWLNQYGDAGWKKWRFLFFFSSFFPHSISLPCSKFNPFIFTGLRSDFHRF